MKMPRHTMSKWVLRGGLFLVAVVALTLASIAGLLFYQGRGALDGTPDYVALGSSFASGPGVTVRVPGSSLPTALAKVESTCTGMR